MYNRRIATAGTAAAATAALLGRMGVAHAQQAPTGQGQAAGAVALGGLVTAVIQNVQALVSLNLDDSLNNLLQGAEIRVVYLNDVLNGAQINVLSDILNNSDVLSDITVDIQNVLNNLSVTNVLTNFLNENDIDIERVIAIGFDDINVLSAPISVYVFEPR